VWTRSTKEKLRGEAKYASFADSYQRAALELSDEKGFFWWGGHRFYDVFDDTRCSPNGNYHEVHINLPRWADRPVATLPVRL
jgi:hypothetical protein